MRREVPLWPAPSPRRPLPPILLPLALEALPRRPSSSLPPLRPSAQAQPRTASHRSWHTPSAPCLIP